VTAPNDTNNDLEHCSYVFHENGIHEFIIKHPTRRAADELVGYINTKLNDIPPTQTIRELVDFSAGVPPIAYLARRGREIMSSSSSPRLRVAFLYQQSAAMTILRSLVDLVHLNTIHVKAFQTQQREQAIEWLLKEDR
jgi:hypothetical protein